MIKSGGLLALIFSIFLPLCLQAQNQHKISPRVLEAMQSRGNQTHTVVVMLEEQVDLEALLDSFRINKVNVTERAIIVNNRLRQLAGNTQAELFSFLNTREVKNIKSWWIINALGVEADSDLINELADMQQVKVIDFMPAPSLLPEPVQARESSARAGSSEKGLKAINAPFMWELGYTGYGRKAWIVDTGVDPKHESLDRNYAGNYFPQKQSWFNPFGNEPPKDCQSHGTHVTGTVVGIDRHLNDTIGVAFDALWMGADIFCLNHDVISTFQWSMDPDDNPNTTDDMPDAVNNSWGYTDPDTYYCEDFYAQIYLATEAAGIAVVFAAGNSGPSSQTVLAPAVVVQSLVNVFSVGAVNGNINNLTVAGFSSVGPTYCENFEGSLAIKPEVSAPGVDVRSAFPGGGYRDASGTSMASPHTTGALVLLKSAFPYLSGEDLKYALYNSARDLGMPGEDNQYGTGIIDLRAAYYYLIGQGHQPVAAKDPYDIRIDKSTVKVDPCLNEAVLYVDLSNNGTLDISDYSLSLTDQDGNIMISAERNNTIAANAQFRDTIILTELPDMFRQSVVLSVQLVHDAETRMLNNYERLDLTHMKMETKKIVLTDDMPDLLCDDSRIILPVQVEGADLLWYGSDKGSDFLGKGNEPVHFPNQDAGNLTIYADWETRESLGAPEPGEGAQLVETFKGGGIQFELFHHVKLVSLDCYAEESGIRIIYLLDSNGKSVKEINKRLSPGKNTLEFNVDLEPGRYTLEHKFGRNLLAETFYDLAGISMDIQGIGTIISGIPGSEMPYHYGFFYNLILQFQSPCARVPFTFDLRDKSSELKAEFSINHEERQRVSFINESEDAITYRWNFGDGNFSGSDAPSHEYAAEGNYQVVLEVTDIAGCRDFAFADITIDPLSTSTSDTQPYLKTLSVFPNPAGDEINVLSEMQFSGQQRWNIIHINGQILNSGLWNDNNLTHKLRIADLPPGFYTIQVIQDDKVMQRARFIKM
ncbi:MAG: S8 family serine peptidase [Saprospiraceae bacterium]|nr:S8 family serine peptidase [Saprospiraceae bacterium]